MISFHVDGPGAVQASLLAAHGLAIAGASPIVVAVPDCGEVALMLARVVAPFTLVVLDKTASVEDIAIAAGGRGPDVIAASPLRLRGSSPAGAGGVASEEILVRTGPNHAPWRLRIAGSRPTLPHYRSFPFVLPRLRHSETALLLRGELDGMLRRTAITLAAFLELAGSRPDRHELRATDLEEELTGRSGEARNPRLVSLAAAIDACADGGRPGLATLRTAERRALPRVTAESHGRRYPVLHVRRA